MAPRRAGQSINGVPFADLPDGETTIQVRKGHQASFEPMPLSREDTVRYKHQLDKSDNGTWAYVGLSDDGALPEYEIAQRHGPGTYRQTPIDPQTRQPLRELAATVKVLPPDMGMSLPHLPTQPTQPPVDVTMAMLLRQQEAADAREAEMRVRRDRLDEEQRQAMQEAKIAAERAAEVAAKREQERFERMLSVGTAVLAGLPALLAGVKTMLAPPTAQPSQPDTQLRDEIAALRREVAAKPKELNPLEELRNLVALKSLTNAIEDMRPDRDPDGVEQFAKIAETAAPMLQTVLDRISPTTATQAASPLSSPDALVAEVMRVGPDKVGGVLQDLARQKPEMAKMIANTLRVGAGDEEEAKPRRLRRVEGDAT